MTRGLKILNETPDENEEILGQGVGRTCSLDSPMFNITRMFQFISYDEYLSDKNKNVIKISYIIAHLAV